MRKTQLCTRKTSFDMRKVSFHTQKRHHSAWTSPIFASKKYLAASKTVRWSSHLLYFPYHQADSDDKNVKRRQTKEVEKPRQFAATAPFACTACVQQHVIHEDAVQNKDVQVNNP
jgi:hypothetical protein